MRVATHPYANQNVTFGLAKTTRKMGTALQTTPAEIDYERLAEAELEAASKATTDLQRHRHLDQAAVYADLSEKSRELPSLLLGQ